MNTQKLFVIAALVAVASVSTVVRGADAREKEAKPKPYPLNTCIVQDEKLDKDAYVFVYKGQEIKLCCESCKGDFNKEPAKFLKKLTATEKPK